MNVRGTSKYLRVALLISTVFLACSCAEKDHAVVTEPMTVTMSDGKEAPASKSGPIQLQRFGATAVAQGGAGIAGGVIYPGTGALSVHSPKRLGGVTTAADGDVDLDFSNVEVREVAKSVLGDLLGLNYLVDNTVQGTITIQTNQKLRRADILPAFETVLRANGLALVRQSGFYSVVPFGNAAREGTVGGGEADYGTEIVTLQYVSPEQMRRVLEPLTPQGSIIQVDQTRNMIVIGGTPGERAAIRANIGTFDVDWLRGMSFAVFKPRIATAKQMAADLQHVMGDENSTMAGQVRLVPIDRMNAVLAIAPQARYLEELRSWVGRLDQGNDTTERRIFVYYVQNGRASDLSRVLGKALGIRSNDTQSTSTNNNQAGGMGRSLSSGGGSQSQGYSGGGLAGGFQGAGSQSQGLGSQMAVAGSRMAGSAGGNNNLPLPSADGAGGNSSGDDQQGGVSITADEVNNALLIVATGSEYEVIEAALKRLDILPLQVMIEAAIAEVTLTKDLRFGVQWMFDNGHNSVTLSGVASGAVSSSFPGFSYLYQSGSRITAVLNALEDMTKVDVLSSPKVLVLNNQTATLEVGDQVPVATQSAVSTLTNDATVVNSIDYKDTGVILTVTPRVNEGGLVLMDISQEVSDVSTTTSSALNSPTINQRKIGSTIAIQDGQTIALGGLILNNRSNGRTGIPYLKDVPVLGSLFRQDSKNDTRTELLVLITPHVIRSGVEAAAITEDLKNTLTNLKDEFGPARKDTSFTPAAKR